jgi:DHA2 family multidrug resistance protein
MPFDIVGVSLLAVGLGALQYVLDEGERLGWMDDGTIVACVLVAIVGLIAFVFWELYGTKTPGVALRVFRQRTVWAMAIINFAVAAGIFALVFIQPQWSQTSIGFTTSLAGILLMVRAGTVVLLFPITTWVTSQAKWDMRIVAAAGMLVAGIATYLQTFVMTTQTSFDVLFATQALSGVGYAFIWVPLSVVLFRTVDQASIPAALALTRLTQQIGASVGSAYAVTLLDRGYVAARSSLASQITIGRQEVANYIATGGSHALSTLNALVTNEALNLAAVDATRFFALATIIAAALPFLLAGNKRAAIAATTPAVPRIPDVVPPMPRENATVR